MFLITEDGLCSAAAPEPDLLVTVCAIRIAEDMVSEALQDLISKPKVFVLKGGDLGIEMDIESWVYGQNPRYH